MGVCFLQLLDLSSPNVSNCDPTAREYLRAVGSQFEALRVVKSKSCRKQTPIFFEKNEGMFSSTFLSEHS